MSVVTADAETGTREPAGVIQSAAAAWSYPLRVYLPPDYAESDLRYPVLFAVDAKTRFNKIADMLEELDLQVIMIGIGTTGDTRREIDFVMPGARNYARFLSDELIPWADARYRTDTTSRGLAGHSLGGLITALTLLLETPVERKFNKLLVSDGSFWNQPTVTRELVNQLRTTTHSLPVTIFMTGATKGNIKGARMFHTEVRDSGFSELDLIYRVYETNHKDAFGPSFRDGLAELYP